MYYRYIARKDASTQTVYVCFCDHANHPSLMADTFFTVTPHWIGGRDTPDRVAQTQKRSQLFGFSVSGFLQICCLLDIIPYGSRTIITDNIFAFLTFLTCSVTLDFKTLNHYLNVK